MPSGGATSDDRPEPPEEATGRHAGGAGDGRDGESGVRRDGDPGTRRNGAAQARAGRPGPNGAAAPIAVAWDERQRRPVTFVWRRRSYRVERVLETWIIETGWWKDDGHVSRSYWRVRAEGRVFDLRYDRLAGAWALEQVLN